MIPSRTTLPLHMFQHNGTTYCGPDIMKYCGDLLQENARLTQWKGEQLEVDASWDVQEVGMLLDLALGTEIRSQIAPCIRKFKQQLADLRKSERELSDAYLRIRAMLGTWDTQHGGVDRFEVTECQLRKALNALNTAGLNAEKTGSESVNDVTSSSTH